MPRTRLRTTAQQSWSPSKMRAAISAVRDGSMGCKKASKVFGVPRTTLKRRVNNLNVDAVEDKKVLGSKRPVFNNEQEQELVNYALKMESMFYGLTVKDVRQLAFQLAERNQLTHPFNKNTGLAGEDWFEGFKKRHPEISLRSPEATSIARAQGFNAVSVNKFFEILKSVLEDKNFPSHRIFNVDETGITTVQTRSNKVLARKGTKQVGIITSAERGVLSTAVICMSPGGNFIPPMLIFPRQRMKVELQDGAPPGTVFSCNGSGWMQMETFGVWFDHFLNHVKPTREDPALLIMDGHLTHTKNLDVIIRARENNVTIITIPPHCSHKLQPLDVSFMAPLNAFYIAAIEKFMRNNPGRSVTQFQVSKLFGEAYLKAATPSTAISGFRKCGIIPFDPDVFQESDFAPSLPSDRPIPDNLNSSSNPVSPDNSIDKPEQLLVLPSTSTDPSTPDNSPKACSSFKVTPEAIMPVPKSTQARSSKRKRSCATILTSSPYKNQLSEEKNRKTEQENKKIQPKRKHDSAKSKSMKNKEKPASRRKIIFEQESSSEEDNDDAVCLFCSDTYLRSHSGEGWIQCSKCLKWAHDDCAGVDDDDCDAFTCDFCLK